MPNNFGRPRDVLAVLQQADKDCGFTSVLSQLTYPPTGKIIIPGNPENANYRRTTPPPGYDPNACDFANFTTTPAQVAFIVNGTSPDTCYGNCATFEAAFNFFAGAADRCFKATNINVDCNNPLYSDTAFTAYLNIPAVKAAIHAPAGITYTQCNNQLQQDLTTFAQRSVPPAYFVIPALIAAGIKVQIWSGTLDYLLPPLGSELVIQNMTWGGAQGFQHRPTLKFFDDQGNWAGVYEIERGLGYWRFIDAGHRTPQDKPAAAYKFVRTWVVGNSEG